MKAGRAESSITETFNLPTRQETPVSTDPGASGEAVTTQEPAKGSPEWEHYHNMIRLKKHDQNKRRRQLEKAAIGYTIADSKVCVSVTLNPKP